MSIRSATQPAGLSHCRKWPKSSLVAVEEASLLMPAQRIVDGVETRRSGFLRGAMSNASIRHSVGGTRLRPPAAREGVGPKIQSADRVVIFRQAVEVGSD